MITEMVWHFRYGYPLPSLAIETARYSVNKLFSNILDAYVEHKGK